MKVVERAETMVLQQVARLAVQTVVEMVGNWVENWVDLMV